MRTAVLLLGALACAGTGLLPPTPAPYVAANGKRVVTDECGDGDPTHGTRGVSPEQRQAIAECKKDRAGCAVLCDPHPERLPPPTRTITESCAQRTWSQEAMAEERACLSDPGCLLTCR